MKKDDIMIKKATMEDAYEIHCIMQEVYDRLEDKKLYVCDDYEFVKNHISENGFTMKDTFLFSVYGLHSTLKIP